MEKKVQATILGLLWVGNGGLDQYSSLDLSPKDIVVSI